MYTDGGEQLHMALYGTKEKPICNNRLMKYIQQHPQSVESKDGSGWLPIHTSVESYCSIDIITTLVDAYPESLLVKTTYGSLPLHMACDNEFFSHDIIKYLASRCPESLSVGDSKNFLSIHFACKHQELSDVIPYLADLYPDSLMTQETSGGYTPIHVACCSDLCDVIIQLIARNKNSLKVRNNEGWLPIHSACRYNTHSIVIKAIVNEYPECLSIKTTDTGTLPLHYACLKHADLDSILFLIEKYPQALQTTNNHGYLPLNLLCSETTKHKSLCILPVLDKYPEALFHYVEFYDHNFDIDICDRPLNSLCLENLYHVYDVILEIIKRYPESLKLRGYFGYPLHYLIRNECDEPFLDKLLHLISLFTQADPNIVHSKDTKDGIDSLGLARNLGYFDFRHSRNKVYRILLNSSPAVFTKGRANKHSQMSRTHYFDMNWNARAPCIALMKKLSNQNFCGIFVHCEQDVIYVIAKDMVSGNKLRSKKKTKFGNAESEAFNVLMNILSYV